MAKIYFNDVLKSIKYNTFNSIEKLYFRMDQNGPQYNVLFLNKNSIPSKCIDNDEFILRMVLPVNKDIINNKVKKDMLGKLFTIDRV
jgi:hypothetical protein